MLHKSGSLSDSLGSLAVPWELYQGEGHWSQYFSQVLIYSYSPPSPEFPQIKWYVLRGQPPSFKVLLPTPSLSLEAKINSLWSNFITPKRWWGHRSLSSHHTLSKKIFNPFFSKRCVFSHSIGRMNWTGCRQIFIYDYLISLQTIPGETERK